MSTVKSPKCKWQLAWTLGSTEIQLARQTGTESLGNGDKVGHSSLVSMAHSASSRAHVPGLRVVICCTPAFVNNKI